jgi:hypothetical protein
MQYRPVFGEIQFLAAEQAVALRLDAGGAGQVHQGLEGLLSDTGPREVDQQALYLAREPVTSVPVGFHARGQVWLIFVVFVQQIEEFTEVGTLGVHRCSCVAARPRAARAERLPLRGRIRRREFPGLLKPHRSHSQLIGFSVFFRILPADTRVHGEGQKKTSPQ